VLEEWDALPRAQAIVAAVSHRAFRQRPADDYVGKLEPGGIYMDVKCQAKAAEFATARLGDQTFPHRQRSEPAGLQLLPHLLEKLDYLGAFSDGRRVDAE